ncbi:hypothetical protein DIPPA_32750 [Diplonema papillatum]|nr:hypothetical protein DIPPA_32750 [Diplonema papillatum]
MQGKPSARAMRRRNPNSLGPNADEEGMGFKVGAVAVIAGSLIFIVVIIIAHFASKYTR